jgi:hypothetical protein
MELLSYLPTLSSMTLRLIPAAVFGLFLAGCTVSEVSLDYQPRPGMHIVGRPEVTVGNFYDTRGLAPLFVGTARNAFGMATEQVLLRVPADQAVRNAFLHALEARKMLAADSGKYYLAGEVVELGCTMHTLPTAIARVRLNVLQVGSDGSTFNLLFPNRLDREHRVAAGSHRLPRPQWRIKAGGPAGTSHLLAIVSPFPRDFTRGMDISSGFGSAPAVSGATRTLFVEATGAGSASGAGRAVYGASNVLPIREIP